MAELRINLKSIDKRNKIDIRKKIYNLYQTYGVDSIKTVRSLTYVSNLLDSLFLHFRTVDIQIAVMPLANYLEMRFIVGPYAEALTFEKTTSLYKRIEVKNWAGRKQVEIVFQYESYNRSISEKTIDKLKAFMEIPTEEQLLLEIKANNKLLDEKSSFLNLLLENIHSLIYTKDNNGAYTFVNNQWEEIWDFNNKEVIGRTDIELFGDDKGNRLHKDDLSIISEDFFYKTEVKIDTYEGPKTFLLIKVAMRDNGNIVGMCGIATDITDQKKMEDDLKNAKKRAEEVTEAKSVFLANMSHEIRTPMNAVLGMTYLIEKTDLNKVQKDYVNKIKRSSKHLLGIINEILDLSKIESNMLELEEIQFGMREIVENMAIIMEEKCRKKNITLVIDFEENLENIYIGDPLRINQILINYTSNALKFTEDGTVSVKLYSIEKSSDIELLKFEVKDTGIGVSKGQIERLFEPFKQADETITRAFGGTGLGLSISKRLAELMGGEVGVESDYGKGSTFWFTFKVKRLTNAQLVKEPQNGRCCLALYREQEDLAIIRDTFKSKGVQVDDFFIGDKQTFDLRKINTQGSTYDLIISDGMDIVSKNNNVEILKNLVKSEPLKIIFLLHEHHSFSSNSALGNSENYSFMTKPINPLLLGRLYAKMMTIEDESSEVSYKSQNIKMLLVEDNELNQEIALALISEMGIDADCVENGQAAIEKIGQEKYDLVLMDVQMPVLDGIEATKRIRLMPDHRELPIIAMTANAMNEDRKKCFAVGMNDYISKPIEPLEFYALIRKWVSKVRVL